MSKIFDWKNSINYEELKIVIDTLENDGIIIFPTDTVYGVGCNCFSEKAIKKIFDIKQRLKENPISVLTNNVEKINKVAHNISQKQEKLIKEYMPGALTIILEKNKEVPSILTANLDTIGVRIPDSKIALEILENFKYPLATTSVNVAGDNPGIEIDDFIETFKDKVDIIIDGGKSEIGIASTVVSVDKDDNIKVLRQGKVSVNNFKKYH